MAINSVNGLPPTPELFLPHLLAREDTEPDKYTWQERLEASKTDPRLDGFGQLREFIFDIVVGDETRILRIGKNKKYGTIEVDRWGTQSRFNFTHRNGARPRLIGQISQSRFWSTEFLHKRPRFERKQIWAVLCALRSAPLESIQDYGRQTGSCMMCGRTLTVPSSVAAGIGSVCAGYAGYDITHEGKLVKRTVLPTFDLDNLLK